MSNRVTIRRWRRIGLLLAAMALGAMSVPVLTTIADAATTTPTMVVDYQPAAPTPGQTVTFTAHVTGTGGTPTGTVNWNIYSSTGSQTCATSTLAGAAGTSTTTCTFATATASAEYFVSATYNGETGVYNSTTKGNYVSTGSGSTSGWTTSVPFNECPTVGYNTSCGILIVLNASGTATILANSAEGPYDDDDDTLVGILNDTGNAVPSVELSSTSENIFGFDADGACSDNTSDPEGAEFGPTWKVGNTSVPYAATGCAYGSYGYEGPNVSFSGIATNDDSGTVNFTDGGLANGGSQWFTLENSLSAASFTVGPDFTVTKSATPNSVAAGSSTDIVYTLAAHNIGGNGASATITDSAPSGTSLVANSATCNGAAGCTFSVNGSTVTWTLTNVGQGIADSLQFSVSANASDPTETIENTATWTGSGCATTGGCSTNTTATTVTNGAAFTVTKSATSTVVAGSATAIAYTISVENTGTSTSTSAVTVTDAAPSGTTYVSGSAACPAPIGSSTCSFSLSGSFITWTISSGVPSTTGGNTYVLAFSATANASDPEETITNNASWTGAGCSNGLGGCLASASTVVTNNSAFQVTKASSVPSVAPGGEFGYTISVSNTSTTAASTAPVTVTDSAPVGTTYVSGSAECSAAVGNSTCSASVSGSTITWTISSGVPGTNAGGSYSLTFSVTANANDPAETITNTATWSGPGCGDSGGCPAYAETSISSNTPSNVVTNSSAPSLGSQVTFTDTVTGPSGDPTPSGAVTWTVTGPTGALSCTNSGSAALAGSGNSATATCTITPSSAGTYSAQTAVAADSFYTASNSSADSFTVYAVSAPTNAVTYAPASPTLGQQVTFTDTLTGQTGETAPTGTVTWSVNTPTGSASCANSGSTALTGSGNVATATCVIDLPNEGNYSATATYSGDSNYSGNSSPPDSLSVAMATPTVVVTNSANPTLGSNVTLTVTVTGPDGSTTPTGTVTWTVNGPSGSISCPSGSISPGGTGSSATATCMISASAAGTYTASAAYSGDGNFNAASSSTDTFSPAGGATQLAVTSEPPSSSQAGSSFSLQVSEEDSAGNVVTTDSSTQVGLALLANPDSSNLTCTNSGGATATLSNGVATFTCWMNVAGTGYTLQATSGSLTSATTNPFNITAGTATQLVFTGEPPSSTTAGTAFSVTVQVEDAYGNPVSDSGVSVSLTTSPSTTISGTTTAATGSSGSVTFGGISIGAANTYNLLANGGGLGQGTSSQVTITVAGASQLILNPQPGASTAGSAVTGTPTVEVLDSSGNGVSGVTVTVAIASGPTGGALTSGSTTSVQTNSSGLAVFSNLVLDTAGTYTLTFASSGLASVTSNSFAVSAAAPSTVTISTQPTASTAGSPVNGPPAVTVKDVYGNVVSGATVTVAINSSPSGATFDPSATTTVTTGSNGVATFSNVILDTVGSYTLKFTTGLITSVATSSFAVAAAPASQFVITSTPVTGPTSTKATLAITVTLEDAFGNAINATATTTVNLSTTSSGGYFATTSGGSHSTTATIARNASSVTFYYGDTTAGSPTIQVSINSGAYQNGTQAETIFGTFTVSAPSTATAGTSFSVTLTAVSSTGATATGYSGTEAITFSGPASSPGGTAPTYPANVVFTNGVGTATITLYDAQAATLTATQGTAAGSASIAVAATTASKLAFTTQPVGGVTEGTAFATQPQVSVEDTYGNTVTGSSVSISLAVDVYTAGNGGTTQGTLSCPTSTTTVAAVSGVATFAGCEITGNAADGSYTFQASSSGLTITPASSAVTIVPGTATQLLFSTEPGGSVTEGTAFTQPKVTIEDANNNVVTTSTSAVTLQIDVYTAGNGGTTQGTLSCTTNPVTPTLGVATFTACKISGTAADGTYTFEATTTTPSLTSAASSSVSIVSGTATKLVFTIQPGGSVTEGTAFTQPQVSVEDANSNVVTGSSASITLAIDVYTAGNGGTTKGTLSCTTNPVAASSGVATFAGCEITGTAADGTYTFQASGTGLTITPASSTVTIVASTATKLAFTIQPGGSVAEGTAFTQPQVSVEDANGNVVTGSSASISLAVDVYTAGNGGTTQGTLSCPTSTTTVTAVSGVATFAGCEITGTAADGTYTFQASSSGLTITPASSTVTIVAGTATQLLFSTEPGGSVAEGTAFTQPQVTIEDANNNVVTTSSPAVTLHVDVYTAGNGGTTQGTLTCTTNPVTPTLGVATFAGCAISGTAAAGSYTFDATTTTPALTSAASSSVSIVAGTATKVVFTVQPGGSVTEGVAFTQPQVSVEDTNSNVVTGSSASISLAIDVYTAGNGGTTQGTLGCTTNPVTATSGVATFAGCAITGNAADGSYTFQASSSGLTITPASSAVAIVAGTATQLLFSTEPGGSVTEGTAFTQPKVTIEDANNNVVTTSTSAVTLHVDVYTAGNGGTTQGTLTCTTNPVTPTLGVATFAGCAISGTAAAGSYTLDATTATPSLTSAASSTVTIVAGTATQLLFSTEPGGSVAEGTAFTQPQVTIEDANNNVVTTSSPAVTLHVDVYTAGNGGTTQGTLTCTTNPVTPTLGVATFAGCAISGTAAAGSYTFDATTTTPALTSAASSSVSIVAGTATKVVFTVQPGGSVTEGVAFTQPQVSVEDTNSNVVTGSSASISLAIDVYTAGNGGTTQGTLGCTTNPVTATSGVATFAGCAITGNAADGSYTFQASSSGLTITPASSAVAIVAGTATQLLFSTEPGGSVTEGTAFTQPKVTIEDANNNVVTTSTSAVTLHVDVYTAGNGGTTQGTLTCTTNPVTPTLGVATFAGCAISGTAAAGSYTLDATTATPSLTSAASSTVTIVAGTATKLAFTVQPGGSVTEGAAFTQPQVSVEDSNGNVVTGSSASISLAIDVYTAGNGGTTKGTLSCPTSTTTVAAISGVATFAGCEITGNAADGTYTFQASGSGLTITPASSVVAIVAGTATQLLFSTEPGGSVTEGTAFTQPKVTIEDANNNVVTTSTSAVTLQIDVYTAGNGGTTQGTLTCTTNPATPTLGVATFAGCAISGSAAAGTYTLDATTTTPSLTSAASSTVTIVAGTATQLLFSVQPSGSVTEGTAFSQPQVTIEDANNNIVTTSTAAVTLHVDVYTAGNGGSTQGTLTCTTNPVTPTLGVATFAGCAISGTAAAGSYTFDATTTTPSLTSAASSSVSIVAGTATTVTITTEPGNFSAGGSTTVVATAKDANGNVATNGSGSVTLTQTSGPGATFTGFGATALSSGTATFTISTTTAGSYTITAHDGSINSVASTSFTVAPGVATAFTIATIANQTAGTSFPVTITAVDQYGNTATSYANSQVITFTGPLMSPNFTSPIYPATVSFSGGIGSATITLYDAVSTTLTASQGSLTGTSNSFSVAPLAANAFWFTPITPSTATAGTAFNLTMSAVDLYGNVATSFTGTKAFSISGGAASPSGALPSYPTSVSFVSGVGTATITLVQTGSLTLTLTATQSSITGTYALSVGSGVVSSLTISIPPAGFAVGGSTSVVVTAYDADGNVAITPSDGIALTSAGVFNGEGPVTLSNGTASFTISSTLAGTFTVTAHDGSIASAASNQFTVTPGPASSFAVTVVGSPTAGTPFNVTITALDVYGNTATSYSSSQTVTFSGPLSSPGGTPPNYTEPVSFSGGVGTASVTLDDAQATTITAGQGSLTGTSTSFTVAPGAVSSLTFAIEPTGFTAGNATTVSVTAYDAYGNLATNATSGVTLTPSSGTFTGTGPVALSGGTATFTISTTGVGPYTVTAQDGAVASTASNSFTVTPAAGQVLWVTEPGPSTAGSTITGPPTLVVQDQYGNPVSGVTVTLTLSTLSFASGTTSVVTGLNGRAVFSNLVIDAAGSYWITAQSPNFTSAPSSTFTVAPTTVSSLAITSQPNNFGAGGSTTVTVTAYDTYGNVATNVTDAITLTSSGSFTGLGPVALSGGTATFTISTTAVGNYTVTANDAAIASAPSNSFTVSPGGVKSLTITAEPSGFSAGGTTTVTVSAYDASGNLATSATDSIYLSSSAGTFSGLGPVSLSGGTATFTISTTAAGSYTVSANDGSVISAPSTSFTVAPGTTSQLVVSTQPPSSAVTGTTITVAFSEIDSYGNLETGDNATTVTLALGANSGSSTLTCTNPGGTTATVSGGVATFTCSLNNVATGYTLQATSGIVSPVTTNSFTITGTSSTGVADNSSTIVTGGTLVFTATVTSSGGNPTGTVIWAVTGPGSVAVPCSSTSALSAGTASCTITGALAGAYSATATYGGSSSYSGSSGTDSSAAVGKAGSSTAVVDNSHAITGGGNLVFTATVSGSSVTPTGAVAWTITGPGNVVVPCSSTTALTGGTATCTVTGAAGGAYSATAAYGGDANYTASSGSDTTAQVTGGIITQGAPLTGSTTSAASTSFTAQLATTGQAGNVTFHTTTVVTGITVSSTGAVTVTQTLASGTYKVSGTDADIYGNSGTWSFTLTVSYATTTTLTLVSPVTYGAEASTQFHVAVTSAGGTPTGSVAVMNGATTLCSVTLSSGSGICTLSAAQLAGGTYSLTAVYTLGSVTFVTSTSTAHSLVINPVSTTTTFTLSTPVTYGSEGSANFNVTVTSAGGTPTGTVDIENGSTTLCAITLSGGTGLCTLSATQLGAGTFSIEALYVANADFSSSSVSHNLVVNGAGTTTTLSFTTPVNYGAEGSAGFSVTVTSPGGTPTGTVAIDSGSTTLCTVTLSGGTGSCSPAASKLAQGTYSITAVFTPPNSNFATSTSTAHSLVINPAPTTTTLSFTSPVTYGSEGKAAFSVTVTSGAGTPTGTVAIDNGPTTLCTVTLSGGTGTCTLTASQLAPNTYSITAVFSPANANFATSPSTAQNLVVNKAATSTTPQAVTVTGSGATRTVTFKATLTSLSTGTGISGQSITFTLNTTGSPTCTATTNSNGVATCSVTISLAAYNAATSYGTSYAGGADYLSSTSTEPV